MAIWEFAFCPGYYSFYKSYQEGLAEELEGTGLIWFGRDMTAGWIVYGPHDSIVGTFRRFR